MKTTKLILSAFTLLVGLNSFAGGTVGSAQTQQFAQGRVCSEMILAKGMAAVKNAHKAAYGQIGATEFEPTILKVEDDIQGTFSAKVRVEIYNPEISIDGATGRQEVQVSGQLFGTKCNVNDATLLGGGSYQRY